MSLNRTALFRILLISASLSLAIVYVLSWVDVISDPEQRNGSDFMAFYAAGRGMLERNAAAAYDMQFIKVTQETVAGYRTSERGFFPYMHPPFILPILWGVAHFEYIPAYILWAAFMLVLAVIAASVAARLFPAGIQRVALWLGMTFFFPVFISLANGQDSTLLLLGGMLWYFGLSKRSSMLAGMGLALTTIRPQVALVLSLPFFLNRNQRMVWWWFVSGALVLVVFSVLLIGVDGLKNFMEIMSITVSGTDYQINETAMFNLIGMTTRLIPGMSATDIRVAGWAGFLIGLAGLCVVWLKTRALEERHIALAVIVALFVSPHLHYHDLALLLIPILGVVRQAGAGRPSPDFLTLLPLGISLLLIATYSVSLLAHPVVYLTEAGLLFVLWRESGASATLEKKSENQI